MRRLARVAMTGVMVGTVAACGMLAGVDSYEVGDLDSQIDAMTPPASTVDGSRTLSPESGVYDGTIDVASLDGFVVDAFDEPPPPPPSLDAAPLGDGCPPSGELNAACGASATCCTNECSERRNCVSSCKEIGAGCSQDQCCVGSFCPFYDGNAKCEACLPSGAQVPLINLSFYNQACCSDNSHTTFDPKAQKIEQVCD